MKLKKILLANILGIVITISSMTSVYAQDLNYKVQSGDTYWIISQKFGVSISQLMEVNHANGNTILYVGQNLMIPTTSTQTIHTVKSGDTYWIISKQYGVNIYELMDINNATQNTILNIGDKIIIPSQTKTINTIYTVQSGDTYWKISAKYTMNIIELMEYNGHNQNTILYIGQKIEIPQQSTTTTPTQPYVTYSSYTVQKGDNIWSLSNKFGIPQQELAEVNHITVQTILNIGDVLKIPVHHIPEKNTLEQYGEYLEWWTEAQYVLPVGAEFKIIDFYTGKSFMAKRTTGTNHADVETLTLEDTNKMKAIWGGDYSWVKRPILVIYNGRKIAASAAGMPHAGNDSAPGGIYTSWRSGDYSGGYNLDWVKNNEMNGVFDVHFYNSTRHKDSTIDDIHQQNVKIAAGMK